MEFSLPVRVRWDIDFRGRVGRAKRIARHIREIGPLFVELRIEGERGLAEFPAVFTEIHKANPRIDVTIRLFPGASAVLRWGYPVDILWEVDGPEAFSGRLPANAESVSFCPDGESAVLLPDVIEAFSAGDVPVLRLTNVNAVRALAGKGHVPFPSPERLRDVSGGIARLGAPPAGKRIVVHDFFLWRMLRGLFPEATGDRIEFSGCQAATALSYLDWEGNVYPCDSLPIRLGNVIETPFERIWRSAARLSVAAAVGAEAAACGSCDLSGECLGGCRGLAHAASGSFEGTDPSCPRGRIPK